MAQLTVTPITRAGIAGTLAAAAGGGDSFANNGQVYVEVVNGGGSPITVSIAISASIDGISVPARTVSVTNGQRRLIGPFPTGQYNDANGLVQLTYSGVTTVTVGAFQLTATN